MKISDLLGEGSASEERLETQAAPAGPAPVSARAQLADLAAGLAVPLTPPVESGEAEYPAEIVGLDPVVDDLLPDPTKRSKGSPRGSSRSGSRRRGR